MNNSKHSDLAISTFVINLKERTERLKHIQEQFLGRTEFDLQILNARKHKIGAIGLWQSIVKIVRIAIDREDDVIVISEDDHVFTDFYNKDYLFKNIIDANEQGVAILSGGIAGFGNVVPLTENRFWVDSFLSTQFIILYKRIFDDIINYKFKKNDVADLVLSRMTSHKMILYPFISEQKDFGYSDITAVHNEVQGIVGDMFKKTDLRLAKIQKAYKRYIKPNIDAEKISLL